jgi:hypothetical protein
MTKPALLPGGNPYPGLRPFREGEEHLFFGRENQVDVMVDKLAASHFLAVVGTSGSGKSSLVNCGLKPALRLGLMSQAGTSWHIVQSRPGNRPIRSLARALASKDGPFAGSGPPGLTLEEIIEATLRMSKMGVADVYEQAGGTQSNLLVVVDQFEELFRYQSTAGMGITEQERAGEGAALVNVLLEARSQREFPIYVVLTMRSDFLGDCAQFAGLAEAINESQYLTPRMTREERRAAIAGPAGVGGAEISTVLLTRLVNDVGDSPDQLSILQHALNRTWARWQQEGNRGSPVDLPHYEAIGTMAHALDQHAEKAYGELANDRQKEICVRVFKTLTDTGTDPRGIRRPTSMRTLCAVANAPHDEIDEVLKVFRKPSRSFLMPPEPEKLDPDTVIDISHESLMRVWERLRKWAAAEADSARLYRRLSDTAALQKAGKSGLLRDPELAIAVEWREREKPTSAWAELYGGGFDVVAGFLRESEEQQAAERKGEEERRERELAAERDAALAAEQKLRLEVQLRSAKRLRALTVGSAILAVAAIALAWVGKQQNQRAERESLLAKQNELQAAAARSSLEASFAWANASTAPDTNPPPPPSLRPKKGGASPPTLTPATAPPSLVPRVYMQIVNENDRGRAREVAQLLRGAGMIVPGIEYVQTDLKTTQVRYYKKAEEATALQIVDLLQKKAGYPDTKLVNLGLENNTKVRPNHFELWLAPKRAAAAY